MSKQYIYHWAYCLVQGLCFNKWNHIKTITLSKSNRCHSKQNMLYFLPDILKYKKMVHCENWHFSWNRRTTYSNMHFNLKPCFGAKSCVWTVFIHARLLYWQEVVTISAVSKMLVVEKFIYVKCFILIWVYFVLSVFIFCRKFLCIHIMAVFQQFSISVT